MGSGHELWGLGQMLSAADAVLGLDSSTSAPDTGAIALQSSHVAPFSLWMAYFPGRFLRLVPYRV